MPVTLAPPPPPTIEETLEPNEVVLTATTPIIEVPSLVTEEPLINTEYNGTDEKVAIAIGTVIIGIWLLRIVMAYAPFFVGLGLVVAFFAFF